MLWKMGFSAAKILPCPPYMPLGTIEIREGFGPLELFEGFSTVCTHLLRGATFCRLPQIWRCISTHAPLARCDLSVCSMHLTLLYFNSRTSCEVRPCCSAGFRLPRHFNSRTSCEVRLAPENSAEKAINFNSRTSCEVRHISLEISTRIKIISTHAPLARCDDLMRFAGLMGQNFNSRTSCEVRRWNMGITYSESISTHAPLARCD